MLNADILPLLLILEAGMTVLDFWDQLMNQAKVYQQGFSDGSDAFAAGKVAMAW